MRSSSIKSLVAMLSIAATLTLTLPATAATRNAQPRSTRGGASEIGRIIREIIKRVGGITTNSGPTIPIGGSGSGTGTTGGN